MWAGVGMRQPTQLPLLPSFALPHLPPSLNLIQLPECHVTRKCGSPPFPLLTERKYCNRGGRRWALLRRWLKITGIFKAAEESQGRQRLDSLPPGRSSLLPRSLFSPTSPFLCFLFETHFTLHKPCDMTTTTTPFLNHIFRPLWKPTTKLYDVMKAQGWLVASKPSRSSVQL